MTPRLPSPLLAAALAAGCKSAQPTVEPPSEDDLARCQDEQLGDTGFDWSCCQVWIDECYAEGGDSADCMWICNG